MESLVSSSINPEDCVNVIARKPTPITTSSHRLEDSDRNGELRHELRDPDSVSVARSTRIGRAYAQGGIASAG
jgi:hypothetical protein